MQNQIHMGRFKVLFGIWVLGYALGIVAYFTYPGLVQFSAQIIPLLASMSPDIRAAVFSGLISSFVTLIGAAIWAYGSRSKSSI